LDPKERNQFSQLLSELSKDKIILLSTHIVSDVEAIADQIMIMKKGRLIAHDTPQKLLAVLDGKVKERLVSQKELEQLRRDTIICY
ncbi:ABC transporter ATP-binding protein, partial [Erysipelatoclostridium ramosum]|nr:ABC transporter ATP-binding protein [Thomasclavelia ramosa]